jgi:hypothetical protein
MRDGGRGSQWGCNSSGHVGTKTLRIFVESMQLVDETLQSGDTTSQLSCNRKSDGFGKAGSCLRNESKAIPVTERCQVELFPMRFPSAFRRAPRARKVTSLSNRTHGSRIPGGIG